MVVTRLQASSTKGTKPSKTAKVTPANETQAKGTTPVKETTSTPLSEDDKSEQHSDDRYEDDTETDDGTFSIGSNDTFDDSRDNEGNNQDLQGFVVPDDVVEHRA